MALSNIFKEPRREIIESAIGLTLVTAYIVLDYHFARWFYEITGGSSPKGCPWPLGMIIGLVLTMLIVVIIFVAHSIDELICDNFEERGIRLRPRR